MNYVELVRAITAVCPDATISTDSTGQIIVYTDMQVTEDGAVVPYKACDCCGMASPSLYDGAAGGRLCPGCLTREVRRHSTALTEKQESAYKALQKYGPWPGHGWTYSTPSETKRLMEALVKKGKATLHNGTYYPAT